MALAFADATASATQTGANDVSPTMPATINAGDLLHLVVMVRVSAGNATVAAPAGWTLMFDFNDTGINEHVLLFEKVAVGGDAAPVLHDSSGTAPSGLSWNMAVIRSTGGGIFDASSGRVTVAALASTGSASVATSEANALVYGVIYDASGRTMSGGTNTTKIFGELQDGGGASAEISGGRYSGSLAAPGTYTVAMNISPFASGGYIVAWSIKTNTGPAPAYVSVLTPPPVRGLR